MQAALQSFLEASEDNRGVDFRTIHALECKEVMLGRSDYCEPLQQPPEPVTETQTQGSKKRPSVHCYPQGTKKVISWAIVILLLCQCWWYLFSSQKRLDPLEALDLQTILSKCTNEEGIDNSEQPLYIYEEAECIKWRCGTFKGSIETRVVNQHTRSSKSHLRERQHHKNPEERACPLEGVPDIRTFFPTADKQ